MAALSIWVSTIARRPRDALFITYGLEALWLTLPPLLNTTFATPWPLLDRLVLSVTEWIGASSPTEVLWPLYRGVMFGSIASLEEMVYWMIALQFSVGVLLSALASFQLRPIFRRQDDSVSKSRGLSAILASGRLRSHPKLGDRPMLWKELHTSHLRGFARFVSWLLTLNAGGFLIYYAVWLGMNAFQELWLFGYKGRRDWTTSEWRWAFRQYLLGVVPLLYLMGALATAGAAASSIASEHEEDTWVSLTSTDLTGWEIIIAKLLGACARARRVWVVIGLLILVGIVVNAVHWIAFPALIIALAIYGWFAAALGVWISVQLRSTWRAQFLTIAAMLLVNVIGQGIINMFSIRGFVPQLWAGFTPYEVAKLIMDTQFPAELAVASWPRRWSIWELDDGLACLTILSVISLFGYAALAFFLTRDALRRFEFAAGRARRSARSALTPA